MSKENPFAYEPTPWASILAFALMVFLLFNVDSGFGKAGVLFGFTLFHLVKSLFKDAERILDE
jgi:hypothetical protein